MTAGGGGRDLALLLADGYLERKSGIVTGKRGKLKRLFCVREGEIVFAASNLVEEQFEESLVRQGLITPADRAAAGQHADREKTKVSAVLGEHGMVAPDQMGQSMQEHVRSLLSSCLEWPDGEFSFAAGQPMLDGEVTVRMPPAPLLVDHARRFPASLDALRARIGNPGVRLTYNAAREPLLESGEPDELTADLLLLNDGIRTLGEVLASCAAEEQQTLRALYKLLLLGVLEKPAVQVESAPEADAVGPPSREEVLARVRKAEGATHYMVLGVDRGATRKQIRDSYYRLARRLHPDRFRSGDLQDLLPGIEVFFSQVTEAYNTLDEPERRKEYNRQLDELSGKEKEAAAESDSSFLARQNFMRGRDLLAKRRYHEAVKFLQNAVELDQTKPEYSLELGLLLVRNPRMRAEAEVQLRRVIKLQPTSTKAYLALGGLCQRAGRPEDAERMFLEALRWDPENVEATEGLAALGVKPRKGGGLKGLFRG